MNVEKSKPLIQSLNKSFFDNETTQSFWKQTSNMELFGNIKYIESEFYIHGSKMFQSWESCTLVIQNTFLVCKRKKNLKLVDYINFDEHIYTIKVIQSNDYKYSTKYKHGFCIYANGRTYDFYCRDKSVLMKWIEQFRKFCVMTDFHENYTVIEMLGVGGYGEVRLIQDKLSKMKRAGKFLKTVQEKGMKAEKQKVMILNEIRMLRKTQHPNVVKIYELYEIDNEICLVLEYIEGERLFDYISRVKKVGEKETAFLMKQLLLTLCYLESMDIIHRDIKTENIMLTKDHTGALSVKLIDFGLSTFHMKRDIIRRCGTPGYAAPEILNNDPYDFKVDLYSVGVILFICLTGRPPFTAEDYNDLFEKNRRGSVNYKGRHWAHLSTDAKNVVQRLLDPLPKTRIRLEDALAHPWFKESLTTEDKKTMNDYIFHLMKINIPEEKEIAEIPATSIGQFSKVIRSERSPRADVPDSGMNFLMPQNSFMMSHLGKSMTKLNSFYKPGLSREMSYSGEESAEYPPKNKSLYKMTTLLPTPQNEWTHVFKKQSSALSVSYKLETSLRIPEMEESALESTKLPIRLATGNLSIRLPTEMGDEDMKINIPDEDDDGTCGDRYQKLSMNNFCIEKLPNSRVLN